MSWYGFRPYVSVAERRRKAEKAARAMAKQGKKLQPVQPEGRKIATTYWGKAWCDNLEAYSDFANRLPRGRSYLTNGSVIDLQIGAGKITALVQGSELYKITIKIDPLSEARWKQVKKSSGGSITNLLDLLQGKLSQKILADITTKGTGLFPSPAEIHMHCSCPDWADVCKHVAAALYGTGTRLDSNPELFFTLRGVDMQELISEAGKTAAAPLQGKPSKAVLADADLSELFGVDIEAGTPPPSKAKRASPKPKVTVKRKRPAEHKMATKTDKQTPVSRKKAPPVKHP